MPIKSRQGGLKQIPMTEIQNSKQIELRETYNKWLQCFDHWSAEGGLDIVCYLSIVICNFNAVSGKSTGFYLNLGYVIF